VLAFVKSFLLSVTSTIYSFVREGGERRGRGEERSGRGEEGRGDGGEGGRDGGGRRRRRGR
jgi:hypothetical protein